ncbi:MAG TPA: WS/DGAT domain-containing protein, partial [Pseudomonadales bacterium]|nr:WS/DGAT domain-containing protein [Pseudomonadales bacterium]
VALSMLTRGTCKIDSSIVDLLKGMFKTGIEIGKNVIDVSRGNVPMPDIRGPKTRFNNPVGPYRIFEAALFNLEDFKAIKNAMDAKINDVALTIISGGIRHYLQHHNELPMEALLAIMPVNMRTHRGDNEENNQVGSIFANIHTDIEDPLERMHAIHKSTDEAKEFGGQTPLIDALKLAGVFSPRLTKSLVHLYIDNKLTEHLPINFSSVISNVPGPPFPLYCSGAKLVQYHGVGLLTPGVGLFHLVMSYCGTVTISIVGDRNIMPDPSFYRECLEKSFNELKSAALKKNKVVKHKTKAEITAIRKETSDTKVEKNKSEESQASA